MLVTLAQDVGNVAGVAIAFSIASGVQQLASEAARASVGGLSDAERAQIAQTFIATHVGAYPFVLPQHLTVTTSALAAPTAAFRVSLLYDLSSQTVAFTSLLPFLPSQLQRSAVVSVGTSL